MRHIIQRHDHEGMRGIGALPCDNSRQTGIEAAAGAGDVGISSTSMIVRPAEPDDAREIAEIHVHSWQAAYPGIVPAEYLASLSIERYEAMWRDRIAAGLPELLVAVEGQAMLGWVAFGPSRDDGAAPTDAEIWAIYVSPSQWSKGVGRLLWHHARERLRAHGFMSVGLWAFPENERAANFYRGVGFDVETSSAKKFTLGNASLNEIRYVQLIVDSVEVALQPLEPEHIELFATWLAREHVARWFGDPQSHVDWARRPPPGGAQAIVEAAGRPVGYVRWQRVSREELDSVGLTDIPENSVDVDLFLGDRLRVGQGIGPRALRLLLASLRADRSIPLVGVTTSIENTAARRAFEKAGFRLVRQYTPPGFGPCWLLVAELRQRP